MARIRKLTKFIPFLSFLMILETLSCSSLQGASPAEPVATDVTTASTDMATKKSSELIAKKDAPGKKVEPKQLKSSEPGKVQLGFQEEFARQLAKAGPKAEGWALFSDGPMGHNGQRWIIKSRLGNKDQYKFCFIDQGQDKCKESELSRTQFMSSKPAFDAAAKLEHLTPAAFDGVNYEYIHAFSGNPHTKRVVFISSHEPFPPAYENIIKALALEPKKPKKP
jgi:hypothetical protein